MTAKTSNQSRKEGVTGKWNKRQETRMTHEYSVQIHNWITQKIEQVKTQKIPAEKKNDAETKEYLSGQLKELLFFQRYLTEHIDLDTQTYHK